MEDSANGTSGSYVAVSGCVAAECFAKFTDFWFLSSGMDGCLHLWKLSISVNANNNDDGTDNELQYQIHKMTTFVTHPPTASASLSTKQQRSSDTGSPFVTSVKMVHVTTQDHSVTAIFVCGDCRGTIHIFNWCRPALRDQQQDTQATQGEDKDKGISVVSPSLSYYGAHLGGNTVTDIAVLSQQPSLPWTSFCSVGRDGTLFHFALINKQPQQPAVLSEKNSSGDYELVEVARNKLECEVIFRVFFSHDQILVLTFFGMSRDLLLLSSCKTSLNASCSCLGPDMILYNVTNKYIVRATLCCLCCTN
jgi:hypothetical protein